MKKNDFVTGLRCNDARKSGHHARYVRINDRDIPQKCFIHSSRISKILQRMGTDLSASLKQIDGYQLIITSMMQTVPVLFARPQSAKPQPTPVEGW